MFPSNDTELKSNEKTRQNTYKLLFSSAVRLSSHFTEQQVTQLSSLKEEYDLLSHSKAEFILHRTRQNIILNQRDLVIYWPLG